jgi:hypothetical protein
MESTQKCKATKQQNTFADKKQTNKTDNKKINGNQKHLTVN